MAKIRESSRASGPLRRSRVAEGVAREKAARPPADAFRFGAAAIDRPKLRATLVRKTQDLTLRELKLIDFFLAHPDEALSRDQLLNAAWGIDYLGTTRTLDQHIVQLRKKVEKNPADPGAILTVHGVGYRYRPS